MIQHSRETPTIEYQVLNYVDEDITVGISIPDEDKCEYFEVRQSVDSGEFDTTETVELEGGSRDVPTQYDSELLVNMPEASELENGSISCDLSVSSTESGSEDFEVEVRGSRGPVDDAVTVVYDEAGVDLSWLVEEQEQSTSSYT